MTSTKSRGITLVKLGGSVITDKGRAFTVRLDTIYRLAEEIHRSIADCDLRLIVGHGGGSFPHTVAQKYATQRGITGSESCRGIALVQEAAAKLNRIVVKALIESGVNAISIQPSGAAISENSRIVKWELDVVEKLLDCNLVPVVYGDVSIDLGQGCCILSTEEIFRHIAAKLPVERIVIGSNVNGIFDKDPNIFQDAQQIPLITPEKFDQVLCFLGKSTGIDVTGGMRSKVAALLEIVKRKNSVKCSIIDITGPKTLEDALRGRKTVGTTIQGQELRVEN